jgi:signal transduction histidine kinase
VRDTGVGIDSANLARVLEPYVQIDNAMIRKHRGLGLGLPLVKRFVELHDGTLTLESEPGSGTTVTVRFPPARSVPQETERPADTSGNTTSDAAA